MRDMKCRYTAGSYLSGSGRKREVESAMKDGRGFFAENDDCKQRCSRGMSHSKHCEESCLKFEPAKAKCRAIPDWRERSKCLIFLDQQKMGLIQESMMTVKNTPGKKNRADFCESDGRGHFECLKASCVKQCVHKASRSPELTEDCLKKAGTQCFAFLEAFNSCKVGVLMRCFFVSNSLPISNL
jgi:hypothetical protein